MERPPCSEPPGPGKGGGRGCTEWLHCRQKPREGGSGRGGQRSWGGLPPFQESELLNAGTPPQIAGPLDWAFMPAAGPRGRGLANIWGVGGQGHTGHSSQRKAATSLPVAAASGAALPGSPPPLQHINILGRETRKSRLSCQSPTSGFLSPGAEQAHKGSTREGGPCPPEKWPPPLTQGSGPARSPLGCEMCS